LNQAAWPKTPSKNFYSSFMNDQKNPETRKKLILVAEDDKHLASAYEIKLKKENFDVIVARDGELALQLIKEKKPDFIILDLIMPVKDGFEILKELHTNPELKDMKVLILSNIGHEESIARARELGALDYIIKSDTTMQEIINKIHSYL
jgi:two-component system alkaline phosphatase synthesis response regulator PhoP